jgi:biopolymer transport protein ExbD
MPGISKSNKIRPRLKIHSGWPDCTAFAGVFFLLLIFFLLGSSFVQVSGIPVDIPQTSSSSTLGLEKHVVTIDRYGHIFFNDLVISGMDRLKERLLELSGNQSEHGAVPTIVIRADSNVPFGHVAKLLSMAEELKLNAFVLTAQPAAKEARSEFMDKEK